jgi:hypothetical protein
MMIDLMMLAEKHRHQAAADKPCGDEILVASLHMLLKPK